MGRFGTSIGLLVCALGVAQNARAAGPTCAEPDLSSTELRFERYDVDPPRTAPPLGDDELPWCASADDARCSQLPGHSAPRELAVRGPAAAPTGSDAKLAPSIPREQARFAGNGLPPARGVFHRVERPPR